MPPPFTESPCQASVVEISEPPLLPDQDIQLLFQLLEPGSPRKDSRFASSLKAKAYRNTVASSWGEHTQCLLPLVSSGGGRRWGWNYRLASSDGPMEADASRLARPWGPSGRCEPASSKTTPFSGLSERASASGRVSTPAGVPGPTRSAQPLQPGLQRTRPLLLPLPSRHPGVSMWARRTPLGRERQLNPKRVGLDGMKIDRPRRLPGVRQEDGSGSSNPTSHTRRFRTPRRLTSGWSQGCRT